MFFFLKLRKYLYLWHLITNFFTQNSERIATDMHSLRTSPLTIGLDHFCEGSRSAYKRNIPRPLLYGNERRIFEILREMSSSYS
jgi:hypothetical protein